MSKLVLKVSYKCDNCTFEFIEQYKKGLNIREGTTYIRVECPVLAGVKCICKTIHCPHCESESISLIERNWIDVDESDK